MTMTVDTVVKVFESEKCGLDMSSYEDLNSSAMNVGGDVNGDCTDGDGKDDYVFVNDSDVASSDEHVKNHENEEVNVVELSLKKGNDRNDDGDVESDGLDNGKLKLENGVDAEEENDGGVESGGVVEENGEIKSVSRIVDVENGDSNVEGEVDVSTGVSVVKEVSDRETNVEEVKDDSIPEVDVDEVEESSDLEPVVEESKEVELGFDTNDSGNVSVDGIGCRSSDVDDNSKDSISDDQESAVVDTEDISSINGVPNAAEPSEVKEVELGFEKRDDVDASVEGITSHSSDVDDNSKDSISDAQELAAVESADITSVNNGLDAPEPFDVKKLELDFENSDKSNVSVDGIGSCSSFAYDHSSDSASVAQKSSMADTEDTAAEVTDVELGFENSDHGDMSVSGIGSRSSDVDNNSKDSVSDAQGSAVVDTEDITAGSSVPDSPEPSEVKVQNDSTTVKVPEGELETEQVIVPPPENEFEIQTSVPDRSEDEGGKAEVTENNGNHRISDLESADTLAMESKPVVTAVGDQSVDNGLAEPQHDGKASLALDDAEDKRLSLDDAMPIEDSPDCQQQNLPLTGEENEGHDLIETEAKIDKQGDVDAGVAGSQVPVLSKSDQGEITDLSDPNLSTEPEECSDLKFLPNNSEGAHNQCNLDSLGMENPVSISIGQFEESKLDSTSRVEKISEADVLLDTAHISAVESELESFDLDAESDMIAQTGQSQEISPEEGVPEDQIAEPAETLDVVGKDFSSEECSTEKTTMVEDTTTDDTAIDADQSYLSGSHAGDDVSENKVLPTSDESSEDVRCCVVSKGKNLILDSAVVSATCKSYILEERQVIGDVSSVADDSLSGSVDDACSQTKFENHNCPITYPADDTHSLSVNANNISDVNLRPNISFGSFGSNSPISHNDRSMYLQTDALNKSAVVSSSISESKLYSADSVALSNSQENGDHCAGFNHNTSYTQIAQPEQINEVSVASATGSEANFSDRQNINPDFVRNPFYWLVKIPRGDEENYRELLRESEIELAEKTNARNALQVEFNKHQAYCRELKSNLEAVKSEAKAANELVRAKRREIYSAQSLINLARHAVTVEDVDKQRRNLERRLEHETHTLREEKELVREIRQLNQQRQLLSANPQRQQEVQQALNQRDQTGEQLKVLKKELDALRDNFSKAYEQVRAAQRKHEDESVLLNDLRHRLISANDIRQEAYACSITLKKQLAEKNTLFYKAKNDLRVAYNYAAAGKKDNLEHHCLNQVEKIMEMWNKNDEFRKEYSQCNMRRMVWKLGTLDGTQLGINEVPPEFGNVSDNRGRTSDKVCSSATVLTVQKELPAEAEVIEDKLSKKMDQKKATPTVKKNEVISTNSLAKASAKIEIEEDKDGPKPTKEEEELTRKAEQSRRGEEEARLREQRKLEEKAKAEDARLREQRKLEEKAKAEEALERKRRNTLKAQARAEFKAQKEAEEREKERERRAKKKQKKRGLNIDITENETGEPSEPSPEAVKEPEVTEKASTVAKRPQKASLHTKPIKTVKPIPPALRSKGKRGLLRYWPYACIVLLAIALFYLGSFERIQTIKQHISGVLYR